eukprot:scaffold44591_cov54-Attheya_sp.AAC.2
MATMRVEINKEQLTSEEFREHWPIMSTTISLAQVKTSESHLQTNRKPIFEEFEKKTYQTRQAFKRRPLAPIGKVGNCTLFA